MLVPIILLVVTLAVCLFAVSELPPKIFYSIIPHKLRVEYKLIYEDRVIENKLHLRFYGQFTDDMIIKSIWARTPNKYLNNLLNMEFKYYEKVFI